jgi:hypothetical protein
VYGLVALAGLDDGVLEAAAGVVIASVLYLALAVFAWPSVGARSILVLLRRGRA